MPLQGRRIAICNWRDPWHVLAGGSERYAWEFAHALRDAGAEVEYLTARDTGQSRRETIDGIEIRRQGGRFGFGPRTLVYLARHRRRFNAVVDIENGIPVFARLAVSRRTALILIVHHVHLVQFDTYFPKPLAWLGRFLEGILMPIVYRNVATYAVSESTRREMQHQLHWRGEVALLRNGSVQPPPDYRVDDHGAESIVVLGRLATHKRVDYVIRAFVELLRRRPGATMDIVGRGPVEAELRDLVDDLGVNASVTVHGFLPEAAKNELLEAARLHVCASDAEGWGQVVIEAAAFGVPTVARDVPGLRDSVKDRVTGWLIHAESGDPRRVVAALSDELDVAMRRLDDPHYRQVTAEACREWAGRFSWERMHQETVAAVADVVQNCAGRSDG